MTTPRKTLRMQFAVYMKNLGDGSASPRFYAKKETAEQAAEKDDERYGDDVRAHEFEIDAETGEILSGLTEPLDGGGEDEDKVDDGEDEDWDDEDDLNGS